MKPIFLSLVISLLSVQAVAATVDVLFIYTPSGQADFQAANASESGIQEHLNTFFSGVGSDVNFNVLGSELLSDYDHPYYGDGIYEDFNDTSEMHYDILTANYEWVQNVKSLRSQWGADVVIFLPGDEDVEADAGGQGPGFFDDEGDGGYILAPAKFAWDEPIFSHEMMHVFGMSHEEMDLPDYSKIYANGDTVAAFEESTTTGNASVCATNASADDGNVPENTIDNDPNTRWSAKGSGQWIEFELCDTTTVSQVNVSWYKGNERASSFDVMTSLDGNDWSLAASTTSSGSSLDLESTSFAAVSATYLRIVGYGNSTNDWNSITEAEIFSESTDVVIPMSVIASSDDGNVADNVLDENPDTRWSGFGVGETLTFDFGVNHVFENVDIAWFKGDSRQSHFEISCSADGVNFYDYEGYETQSSSGTTLELESSTIACDDEDGSRYIRITGMGNTTNDWNSITEVKFYGVAN